MARQNKMIEAALARAKSNRILAEDVHRQSRAFIERGREKLAASRQGEIITPLRQVKYEIDVSLVLI